MKLFSLLAISIITFQAAVASGDPNTVDYLYSPSLDQEQQLLIDRINTHARNTEYDYAITLSDELLRQVEPLSQTDTTTYGQILVNHGIIHSAASNYELGLSVISRGLEFMEERVSPFSRTLINAIMAKALTEMALERHETSEDTFRWAQNITHRQGGVYAREQIPIVEFLTASHLRQGQPQEADREQLFSLRVHEQVHGPDSLALLPVLNKMGSYFATRGSTIPVFVDNEIKMQRDDLFKHSIELYLRAIDIIEKNYGSNDLRLVEPLRGMASARMLQITSRKYAEDALKRALEIVDSNPDSDITDRAQAMVDLGDLYTIIADSRAAETYLGAWHLLQERNETRSLAVALFGTPIRLFPRENKVLYLSRQPDDTEPGDPLYVTIEYSVTPDGRVNRVGVLDKNVPNEQVRMMRQRVRSTRFRPRIHEGELLPTEGLVIYQPFQVARVYSEAERQAASAETQEEDEDNPEEEQGETDPMDAPAPVDASTIADDEVS